MSYITYMAQSQQPIIKHIGISVPNDSHTKWDT